MEEIALRWIERVGFPIFVSVLALYAAYRLFMLRETERQQGFNRLASVVETNTMATAKLAASQEETNAWWRKIGSDPSKLCRAAEASALLVKAAEASALLVKAAEASALIVDDAAVAAAKKVTQAAENAAKKLEESTRRG